MTDESKLNNTSPEFYVLLVNLAVLTLKHEICPALLPKQAAPVSDFLLASTKHLIYDWLI